MCAALALGKTGRERVRLPDLYVFDEVLIRVLSLRKKSGGRKGICANAQEDLALRVGNDQ